MRLVHIMVSGDETGYTAKCAEFVSLKIDGAMSFEVLKNNIDIALSTVLQESMDIQIFYTYNFTP